MANVVSCVMDCWHSGKADATNEQEPKACGEKAGDQARSQVNSG
jgi:hypothetical protein